VNNKEQIKWAIKAWRDYVNRETFLPAKNTGLKALQSLELELEHGEPYCVCHLDKLKDCPAQSQNRYRS
jgi:hypothetical protein